MFLLSVVFLVVRVYARFICFLLPTHSRGGGGGLWHALPGLVDGTITADGIGTTSTDTTAASPGADTNAGARSNLSVAAPWAPTHIMQLDASLGDGAATFALLQVVGWVSE